MGGCVIVVMVWTFVSLGSIMVDEIFNTEVVTARNFGAWSLFSGLVLLLVVMYNTVVGVGYV